MDLKKYLPSDEMIAEFEEFKRLEGKSEKEEFKNRRAERYAKMTPDERAMVDAQTMDGLNNINERVVELTDIVKLGEITKIISLSYVSKKYFGRTRQWLYQRLNGNIVNGKQAKFTDEERKKLSMALDDISALIKETGLKIA